MSVASAYDYCWFLEKKLSRGKVEKLIYEGNLEDLFLGKKQNGRKETFAGTHFRSRKPIIQHIFSFD